MNTVDNARDTYYIFLIHKAICCKKEKWKLEQNFGKHKWFEPNRRIGHQEIVEAISVPTYGINEVSASRRDSLCKFWSRTSSRSFILICKGAFIFCPGGYFVLHCLLGKWLSIWNLRKRFIYPLYFHSISLFP